MHDWSHYFMLRAIIIENTYQSRNKCLCSYWCNHIWKLAEFCQHSCPRSNTEMYDTWATLDNKTHRMSPLTQIKMDVLPHKKNRGALHQKTKSLVILRFSQWKPLTPNGQRQKYLFIPWTQVPPFSQSTFAHSSMSKNTIKFSDARTPKVELQMSGKSLNSWGKNEVFYWFRFFLFSNQLTVSKIVLKNVDFCHTPSACANNEKRLALVPSLVTFSDHLPVSQFTPE